MSGPPGRRARTDVTGAGNVDSASFPVTGWVGLLPLSQASVASSGASSATDLGVVLDRTYLLMSLGDRRRRTLHQESKVARSISTKRTVSPALTRNGSARAGSKSRRGVRPISRQPPGLSTG